MGKLIKNHWARLIVLVAAGYHFGASLEGFFWPKFFFDWLTKNFDLAVKPIPILQTINIVLAIVTFAAEWPIKWIAGTAVHKSIEIRLLWLPFVSLASCLLYQGMDPAMYYLIAVVVYFCAYAEGEVICKDPWTLPRRAERRARAEKV